MMTIQENVAMTVKLGRAFALLIVLNLVVCSKKQPNLKSSMLYFVSKERSNAC